MATEVPVTSSNHERRQNALADIQFASILDEDDLTPVESGDETELEQKLELEAVQSAIGVSIGQQQTHLISPKTPAAEKAAALEDVEGGGLFDGWEQHATAVIDARTRNRTPSDAEIDENRPAKPVEHEASYGSSPDEPLERLPSPWRAGPKTFQGRMNDHRASLRQHLSNGRRRASSSGSMAEAVRKYVPFSLPKAPKHLQFSLPSLSALSLDHERGKSTHGSITPAHQLEPTSAGSIPQQDGNSESASGRRRSSSSPQEAKTTPSPQGEVENDSLSTLVPRGTSRVSHDRPPPRLRRSNSEGSLLLLRSKSIASSLGDDSRFESVSEQVNSRLKAIKDSFQDSNFKLPSPHLPNFTFAHKDDVSRSRNGYATPRGRTTDDYPTRRSTLRPNPSATFPRNSSSVSLRAMRPFKDGSSETDTYPNFTKALENLEGDLVILGGYRGSILRSAEPPNRQLWVPIKVGLNLRKVDLEVPFDEGADERMKQTIIPDGMLTHIGPVDISKRLFKRLRASENFKNGRLRVHNYGYDWRLSPHFLSRQLQKFLESLPCNQDNVPREKKGAIVIAHSLGGLITRHAINQQPSLVSGVVYAGVPQNCVNILGPFRNGDDVLLSSRVLTAQVNFSIRTSYALLPLDGKCFFNKHTKEEYPVDFFDVNTWIEGRLSPCIAPPLPRPEPSRESSFTVSGVLSAMSQALPTFPGRKGSISRGSGEGSNGASDIAHNVAKKAQEGNAEMAGGGMEPQMMAGRRMSRSTYTTNDPNPATAVTIPRDEAIKYLTRVLAETKRFKEELAHEPKHTAANVYPPIALMYGKSTPTVFGAKVESREAIARADVYDELAFASGDGVVLARAAMVPEGYSVVRASIRLNGQDCDTMSGSPTLVFTPGAWHRPTCYIKVIKALQEQCGIKCISFSLPSTSGDPKATFKNDLDAARTAISSETTQGHDVVLVAHSYGGMVANSAIKGFAEPRLDDTHGRIVGLVLIASGFTLTGLSFMDPFLHIPPPSWRANRDTGFAEFVMPPRQLFYHDLLAEEAEEWVAQLKPQSLEALFKGGEHAKKLVAVRCWIEV
ncbi:hypothetical protein E8E13_001045 [Curvularia kusanoi]|uniref:AB hydrolase-1 domain-containing protein n=1 Tax=Curvularia kusanoi TaxID=90978 RepID=A0A9P4T8C7_CURKU|nr:hypothetical protein E8E13_001045 [Curvularia kusanoi]